MDVLIAFLVGYALRGDGRPKEPKPPRTAPPPLTPGEKWKLLALSAALPVLLGLLVLTAGPLAVAVLHIVVGSG